ncbi:DNA/RNA non-specific endonuclease [Sulfuricurvum sp.]|uniref:DNA/RNA non-specific endonuclease n=1 Tax=Sulfuricurvum sp. TaxID=2025608 RepID=UPI00356B6134
MKPFQYFFIGISSTLLLSVTLHAHSTHCEDIYFANTAPDILNSKLTVKTEELCFSSFAVMHSGVSRTPLWSAEHLTRDGLCSKSKRSNNFHPEEQLRPDFRAELKDYSHSKYDRGHMAPAADMPTVQAQHECFTLANMIPQDQDNNRGIWAGIEEATRELTKQKGELYIITGPLFIGSSLQRIGGRVLVPTKIYKVIYDPATDKAAAYIVDNKAGENYKVISISQLEQLSDIRFFPKMDESSKNFAMKLPDPIVKNKHTHDRIRNDNIFHFFKIFFQGIY